VDKLGNIDTVLYCWGQRSSRALQYNLFMLCFCRSTALKHTMAPYRLHIGNQLLGQLRNHLHWKERSEIHNIQCLCHCQWNRVPMLNGKLDQWSGPNFV